MLDNSRIGTMVAVVLIAPLLALGCNALGGPPSLLQPRVVLVLSLLMLTCAPVLLWRERDNILAYPMIGTFVVTLLLPLVGTASLADFELDVINRYAGMMVLGALAFGLGLAAGGHFGNTTRSRFATTFERPLVDATGFETVRGRARFLAGCAAVTLVAAFGLLGYVPLLAADRQSAKYGFGAYAPGFARGQVVYHIALTLAGAVLPVMLVLAWRRRALIDISLCIALTAGLAASLSRTELATPFVLAGAALAIERRVRPALLVLAVSLVFVGGALANELVFPRTWARSTAIVERVAASAPDVHDQLSFVEGFERQGSQLTHGRTLLGGLLIERGYWDPAAYSIRITTGVSDASVFASGGVRLPAPLWGLSSFGLPGVFAFSMISGFFTGWGIVRIRRLLAGVRGADGFATNLVVAAVVFRGTFGLLASFYFPASSGVVLLAVAAALAMPRRRGGDAAVSVARGAVSPIDEPRTARLA